MKHRNKLVAGAAVAVVLAGAIGATSAQASPGLEVSSPVTVGDQYTVEGANCAPTIPASEDAPELYFVDMEVHFRESGDPSWPGAPGTIVVTENGWELTGDADRAGTYSVTQICRYEAYDGELADFTMPAFGSLVVNEDSSTGGGDNGGNPTVPALPAEPVAGASTGGMTVVQIEKSGGVSYATVAAGTQYAGQTLFGTLFSTPRSLGAAVVSASGEITFALPSDMASGIHKLVLQRTDGTVIGFVQIALGADGWYVVKQSTGTALANTGGESLVGLGVAGASALVLGAGVLIAARRRLALQ